MKQNSITSPHLSIIMPVFNHKEMVATMIDSILANDYQDWELLAVDDGSTQDTLDLLKYNANLFKEQGRSLRTVPGA